MAFERALQCFPGILFPQPAGQDAEEPVAEAAGGRKWSDLPEQAHRQFLLGAIIGSGASGTVFHAIRKTDGGHVVAKLTDLSNLQERNKEYARSEIYCLAQCDHFAIIRHDASFENPNEDQLLLVMEYADAGDLSRQLKARAQHQQHFQEHEVAFLFFQLLLAVDYAHRRRMLHRDVKSANAFLMSSGLIKLGDFGFSQQYEDTVSNEVGHTFCGTPYYLAPELWRRARYSKKADVWALGVVLYEMATLRRPFGGNTVTELMDQVLSGTYEPLPAGMYSDNLSDVVAAMLHTDVNARPGTQALLRMPYLRYVADQFMQTVNASDRFDEAVAARIRTAVQESMGEATAALNHAPRSDSGLSAGRQTVSAVSAVSATSGGGSQNDETASNMQPPHISRCGVIIKHGSRGWRDRFLCVGDGAVTVSLPGEDTRSKKLPLSRIASAQVLPMSESPEGRPYAFTVFTVMGSTLVFQAASEADCAAWVACFEGAVAQARLSGSVSGEPTTECNDP